MWLIYQSKLFLIGTLLEMLNIINVWLRLYTAGLMTIIHYLLQYIPPNRLMSVLEESSPHLPDTRKASAHAFKSEIAVAGSKSKYHLGCFFFWISIWWSKLKFELHTSSRHQTKKCANVSQINLWIEICKVEANWGARPQNGTSPNRMKIKPCYIKFFSPPVVTSKQKGVHAPVNVHWISLKHFKYKVLKGLCVMGVKFKRTYLLPWKIKTPFQQSSSWECKLSYWCPCCSFLNQGKVHVKFIHANKYICWSCTSKHFVFWLFNINVFFYHNLRINWPLNVTIYRSTATFLPPVQF